MAGLELVRGGTIARGASRCAFRFTMQQSGVSWTCYFPGPLKQLIRILEAGNVHCGLGGPTGDQEREVLGSNESAPAFWPHPPLSSARRRIASVTA